MKRINESEIISSGRPVRPLGHPDLFWYRPDYAIKEGSVSEYKLTGIATPLLPGANFDSEVFVDPRDVPQLSDIQVIENTTYIDEAGKTRAKVVLKIKNSSKKKEDTKGIDARIYQPRGA